MQIIAYAVQTILFELPKFGADGLADNIGIVFCYGNHDLSTKLKNS